MTISSRNKRFTTRRLCADAALICAALAFSYLEAVLPVSLLIPLPGVKLGLANLAVMLAFFVCSPVDAALVSFVRILLSALLFGSPVSFVFALLGGAMAYGTLFLSSLAVRGGKLSFIGASVISSAAHGCGQIIAASVIYSFGAAFYLPVLLICGIFTGAAIGAILNVLYMRTEKIINVKAK